MPFTISHAVAVLPLVAGRPGKRLVPAALVVGSWVPDLPYFVPPHTGSRWTHAASGPVTVDLVLGLVLFSVWELLLRRPAADLAPGWLRHRWPAAVPLTPARWLAAAVSVVLGAATHVVWDTFTHADRWGTEHVAALQVGTGGLPLYKWAQFASGVLGLLVLAVWVLGWLRRTAPRPARSPLTSRARHVCWVLLGAAVLVPVAGRAVQATADGARVEVVAVGMATTGIGAAGAAVLLVALLWWLRSGRALRQAGGVGEGPTQGGER